MMACTRNRPRWGSTHNRSRLRPSYERGDDVTAAYQARPLRADFAAETLAGGLPGHTQGGDPVPAPPVRPGQGDAFGEQPLGRLSQRHP